MTNEWAKVYVRYTERCVHLLEEGVLCHSIHTLRQTLTTLQTTQHVEADEAFETEITRAIQVMETELARRGLRLAGGDPEPSAATGIPWVVTAPQPTTS